ncbi:MAG: hypothetical protein LQ352_004003 [Teloschistes flavicans]|nr:MAG: hypothetical protein LQ352_004003 [Teloschistes flavicans]
MLRGSIQFVIGLAQSLSEARVFSHATSRLFLQGLEGGINDCGLFVGEELPAGDTATDRMFEVQASSPNKPTVIPLDIKMYSPIADPLGNIHLTYRLSDESQGLIILSHTEPSFVALVPIDYISQQIWTIGNIRPLWTLHPVPAFWPELWPFILPFQGLNNALAAMRNFHLGRDEEWINHYTGVRFFDASRPTASGTAMLEPDHPPFRMALGMVKYLHKALQQYLETFRVEFVDSFPLLHDLKIVHKHTGVQIFVEMKKSHALFRLGGPGSELFRHMQYAHGDSSRAIFSWEVQWDFIYTLNESPREHYGLFIPRDKIPSTWWHSKPSEGGWLYWPADDIESLRDYVIDLEQPRRLASDIERILHLVQRENSSMQAQKAVAVPQYSTEDPSWSMKDKAGNPNNIEEEQRCWMNGQRQAWNSSTIGGGLGHLVGLRVRTVENLAMKPGPPMR